MTVEEAIEILEYDANKINNPTYQYKKDALKMAIEALKDKSKHAYVIVDEDGNTECSNCGSSNCFDNYCGNCGAKLIGTRKEE